MSISPTIQSSIVIGGGILGVSTAVQLARIGVSVTLVNDGPVGKGASGRSLAWLNSSRRRSDAYHRLRLAGIERYRVLAQSHPSKDWLRFDGGLTWDDETDNDIADVYRYERDLGYQAELLSPEKVAARISGVDAAAVTAPGAIFNPNEGWVDLPELIKLLVAEFTDLGGTIVTDAGEVEPVIENGRATGARASNGSTWHADAVLLATGPSVPAMSRRLGIEIDDDSPIALLVETKPIEHPLAVVLNTPRVAIRRTPTGALFMDSAWSEEEVVVHEDGRYEARPETVEGLLREARNVLEPKPDLEVQTVHMGSKPIPGDGEPVLGQVQSIPGLYVAFSHSGATLGLVAGEILAEEMAFDLRHPLLETFRPERFASK
ncbi:NAD(P)/FAD-dependent oxidoreductase [Pararhizobium mangrovi]|uniref:FAD-binding oxidoreductase n=1 Tax=Pararhizobium mangrovi TaxID=2590452 RepID=A0A506U0U4_9HYPH|nr:FAD-binding oxidoreductase [Pararhizobium mangrovi]TPW26229.1 FAD-binding oxidoreductase [Pararhizobium mangrovi]